MKVNRICIYPKDIQRITGRSERYGRRLLERIKDHLDKERHQFITIDEFCDYSGIKREDIKEYLKD
ncbi:hypothetical protein CW751_08155 [Brumimicrobium salinarum]|uniref:Uncharacterized protein n=1 Tax=Brumimicrobium salinarum TaxID=2058658 RepID=A0A2I0R2C6_9FLAO|nr:hypothetical protein [Brumimicrobium salinarum]PKR80734.1 hypothetical protein CW751_08155 [Brumimicrobium salinarum]